MYIATIPNRNSPPAILLRESYRENGKVKTRTLANLSKLPTEAIDALKQVLNGKQLVSTDDVFEIVEDGSRAHGNAEAVLIAMRRLGFSGLEAERTFLDAGFVHPRSSYFYFHLRDHGCFYQPQLEAIEKAALDIEAHLKEVPGVQPATVFADRVVGKPYIEIDIDREAIGRYGLTIGRVQDVIQVALGGRTLTTTVEGRERYPVRVRYMREERDSVEALGRVLVSAPGGEQIPLEQLTEVRYVKGPQVIKSEDTFLTSYVLFDKLPELSEVDVVDNARTFLSKKIEDGMLEVPAGVNEASRNQ